MEVPPQKSCLCLFAGFDAEGVIHDYVIRYIAHLAESADVYYQADCEMAPEELKKLSPYTKGACAQRHEKYDFGSWQKLFLEIGWEKVMGYEQVILCNDSCYGPFHSITAIIHSMKAREIDFWGLTDNHQITYHLQSYFLCFSRDVVKNKVFQKFFQNIKKLSGVREVILNYELTLTAILKLEGFTCAAYVTSCERGEITLNPYTLVREFGFPLFKVKCLTRAALNEDISDCIEQNFKNLPGNLSESILSHVNAVNPQWKKKLLKKCRRLPKYQDSLAYPAPRSKYRLLVHLYVTQDIQLPYFIQKIKNIPEHFDTRLVISLTGMNEFYRTLVKKHFPQALCFYRNREGALHALMKYLNEEKHLRYDFILNLNTVPYEKNINAIGKAQIQGYGWRNELSECLLQTPEAFDKHIEKLSQEKNIALVASENLILTPGQDYLDIDYSGLCAWSHQLIKQKMPPFYFVAGATFLAKTDTIISFLEAAEPQLEIFTRESERQHTEVCLERALGMYIYATHCRVEGIRSGYTSFPERRPFFLKLSSSLSLYSLKKYLFSWGLKACLYLKFINRNKYEKKMGGLRSGLAGHN